MVAVSRFAASGLLLPLFLLVGCHHDPAALSPAATMLGEWSYAASQIAEPPTLNSGLHVGVVIDSIDGARFWGRVAHWFAGDVGISPSAFGRLSGSIDDVNEVTLVIPRETPGDRVIVMGALAGDVLTVRDCHMGSEPGPFADGSAFMRLKSGGLDQ
jgi:hypothetical protein